MSRKKIVIELSITDSHPLYWIVKGMQKKYGLPPQELVMASTLFVAAKHGDILADNYLKGFNYQKMFNYFRNDNDHLLYDKLRKLGPKRAVTNYDPDDD